MPIKLSVTTVERKLLEREDVKSITIPTIEGVITILPNHEPLMTALKMGELNIQTSDSPISIFIDGGVAQIDQKQVEILTQLAETAEDLDEAKIEEAKRRAEKLLEERPVDVDLAKVEVALQREIAKMRMVRKWKEQKH